MPNHYTTWEQEHTGDTRGEALCDAWNARNAAELARADLDARVLGSANWVPPSEVTCKQFNIDRNRPHVRYLGRGNKISLGSVFVPGTHQHTRELNARYRNVCRPFDEAHAIRDEIDREWYRLRWCNSLVDENGVPILKPGELDALNSPRDMRPFRATVPKRLDAWIQFATPPNHGHGAACGCVKLTKSSDNEFAHFTARIFGFGETPFETAEMGCPWCAGTGNVICDDERAGRVTPSHAAGGYEEWLNRDAFERGRTGRMPAFNWPQLSGNSG